MTHRQSLAWEAWLDQEMDRPSRTDFYVMQLACTVEQLFMDDPSLTNVNKYRLTFGDVEAKAADVAGGTQPQCKETETEILDRINRSQTVWGAALGIRIPPSTGLPKKAAAG
jgi:hypothetical protein